MTYALGVDFSKNVSIFTIPAALVLAMIPHTYASIAAGRDYDPAYPRKMPATLAADEKMDKVLKLRILRANAAFENSIETLGYFTAAVLAANLAGLDVASLNFLTLGYLASRAAYLFIYVRLQDNRVFAPIRSLAWTLGIGLTTALYVKAGIKMYV